MTPVAWLHILDNTEGIEGNEPEKRLTFSEESPFGIPGIDHSDTFAVRSVPLYSIHSISEVEPDGRQDRHGD